MTHTANDTQRPSENHTAGEANRPQRPSEKPAKPLLRRLAKYLLILILILILILAGALCWLAATESGLRFALARLPQLGGVSVRAENLKGTLWHGFSGSKISVQTRVPTSKSTAPPCNGSRSASFQTASCTSAASKPATSTSNPSPPRPKTARPPNCPTQSACPCPYASTNSPSAKSPAAKTAASSSTAPKPPTSTTMPPTP
ncbi:hypothetical protein LVJ84_03330 [Kingella potus]|nr:hypothetical protein [Kingella potus]UOP01299.1 hypothetical protein LVJ84_03330 [Kingella potus]